MGKVLTKMQEFPPGAWDLEDAESFGDWSDELKAVPSSTLSRHRGTLRNYSAILDTMSQPIQLDPEAAAEQEQQDEGCSRRRADRGAGGGGYGPWGKPSAL